MVLDLPASATCCCVNEAHCQHCPLLCVCVRASSQEANGGVPSLNPGRERSGGAVVQGGVASEKEALLLGKY